MLTTYRSPLTGVLQRWPGVGERTTLESSTVDNLSFTMTANSAVIQRRFLETPGQLITSADTITVRLDRRAYSPVLRQADLPDTPVPWWDNRTLRYEFA